jgi:4-hydroxy-tetrahydrodipicolinate synthase
VDGIVAVGTTGESPTLTTEEHIEVIKKIRDFAGGRAGVLGGTGSNSTAETLYMTKECEAFDLDGYLIVAPYYNKPSQEGVYRHFAEIAKVTEKPVMLYSIPGRCGIEISNDTVMRLRNGFSNFTSLKEAGGKVEKVADMHAKAGDRLDILSGDDGLTLDFMNSGAKGIVSVASNVVPSMIVEMVAAQKAGDTATAKALNAKMAKLFKNLFVEPNPVPAKYSLFKMGLIESPAVRLPLCEMADANKALLDETLRELELI